MNKIDPNEAPDGYIAVKCQKAYSCNGCAFHKPKESHCSIPMRFKDIISCVSGIRKDGMSVIFKKKVEPKYVDLDNVMCDFIKKCELTDVNNETYLKIKAVLREMYLYTLNDMGETISNKRKEIK